MADYYLINDKIKFYFDIEDQHIEYQGNQQSLEPKESKILKYIIENHVDGLIKSEDILDNNWDYWSDKKVLQKVLSTLRRKFKLIGVTENGFIAAGTAYKINYRGVLANDHAEQRKAKKAYTNKILNKINSAAIWAFLGAISIFIFIESDQEVNFKVDNIFQATSLPGIATFPAASPDGKAIVFTHKTEEDSKIYLKVESKLSYQSLTSGFEDQMPAWSPDGRKIAFHRTNFRKSCEIRLIELNQNYDMIGSDKKLLDCNPNNTYSSITWRTNDEFFYGNKQGDNIHYDIMTYSLIDDKSTLYFEHTASKTSNIGSGHYFLNYNQHDQSLYTLSSPDYYASLITRFDANGSQTFIHRIEGIIVSIGNYKNTVIFKDVDNQVKALSLDNPEDIATIYQNPLKPISYPTVSSNSNKLLLLSGSLYRDDIYAMNIKDNTSTQVLSSQYRLERPQQINDQLYYISDRTGISQIYSHGTKTRHQITNFTKDHQIIYYSASNDNRWLAVNYLRKTVLYKRQPEGLVETKTFPLMSHPAFSPNSSRLLLASVDNEVKESWTQNLIEYDLATMTETGIQIKDASFGKYHKEGIIFARPDGSIQIFTLNGIDTLYDSKATTSPLFLTVNKDYVFFVVNETGIVKRINIITKEIVSLSPEITGQITSDDDSVFYRKKTLNNLSIFKGDLVQQ